MSIRGSYGRVMNLQHRVIHNTCIKACKPLRPERELSSRRLRSEGFRMGLKTKHPPVQNIEIQLGGLPGLIPKLLALGICS